jgi:hypothetical protein
MTILPRLRLVPSFESLAAHVERPNDIREQPVGDIANYKASGAPFASMRG